MHLHAEMGDLVADIGGEGLGDGRQERGARAPRRAVAFIGGAGHVERDGGVEADGAGGRRQRLHGQQHPAHVGVVDDRRAAGRRLALLAFSGVGERLLRRSLRHAEAFDPDAEAGVVHHGEHRGHAAMLRPHQPALGVVIFHHGGGGAVEAEFMLETDDLEAVAFARFAIRVGDELRYDKERNALRSRHAVGQAGQHKVADVFGEIVVAP